MTAHELAKKLLKEEDLEVIIPIPNTRNDVQIVTKLLRYNTGNPYQPTVNLIMLSGSGLKSPIV